MFSYSSVFWFSFPVFRVREEFLPVVQSQQTHARALRRAAIQMRVLQQGKKFIFMYTSEINKCENSENKSMRLCPVDRALAPFLPDYWLMKRPRTRRPPLLYWSHLGHPFGPGSWLLFLWTDTFRGDTSMLIIARCTPTLLSARIILSIYGLGMSQGGFFFVCPLRKTQTSAYSPFFKGSCSTQASFYPS